jgi:4a-hydroxytetrahydrobiopterin dehydratase
MNELAQLHCSKITKDTAKLSDQDVQRYLDGLPDWIITMAEGEPRLERVFKFNDFKQAADFTQQLAKIADEEDHHPALLTEWGKVTVYWWTHRIRGLHQNDFIMAAKTQTLYDGVAHGNETA